MQYNSLSKLGFFYTINTFSDSWNNYRYASLHVMVLWCRVTVCMEIRQLLCLKFLILNRTIRLLTSIHFCRHLITPNCWIVVLGDDVTVICSLESGLQMFTAVSKLSVYASCWFLTNVHNDTDTQTYDEFILIEFKISRVFVSLLNRGLFLLVLVYVLCIFAVSF